MAVWKSGAVRGVSELRQPDVVDGLAERVAGRPAAAWAWIARLEVSRTDAAPRRRGVVATPPLVADRMARALLASETRGTSRRILDAGCGGGRLLVAVARQAARRGLGVDLEGVEIDPAAARWAAGLEPLVRAGAGAALAGWRIHTADFLVDDPTKATFDAAIANPPYVTWRDLDPADRERLRRLRGPGRADLAALFVGRILDQLRPGGRLCVIVPNKLAAARYAAALRYRLLHETTLEEIWDLSSERVFRGHASYPIVLVARRRPAPLGHRVVLRDAAGAVRARWPQATLQGLPDGILPLGLAPELLAIVPRLFSGTRLGDVLRVECGIAVAGFGRAIGRGRERILRSGDVRPFAVRRAAPFAADAARVPAATVRRLRRRKVLVPGMFRRLCAAYDGRGSLVGRVYVLPVEGRTPAATEKRRVQLLALFNSRLYALLYAGVYAAVAQSGGYLRANGPYLASLPWPADEAGEELGDLVRAAERGGGDAVLAARLDRAVESLFGLGPDDSRILERLARALPAVW